MWHLSHVLPLNHLPFISCRFQSSKDATPWHTGTDGQQRAPALWRFINQKAKLWKKQRIEKLRWSVDEQLFQETQSLCQSLRKQTWIQQYSNAVTWKVLAYNCNLKTREIHVQICPNSAAFHFSWLSILDIWVSYGVCIWHYLLIGWNGCISKKRIRSKPWNRIMLSIAFQTVVRGLQWQGCTRMHKVESTETSIFLERPALLKDSSLGQTRTVKSAQ